MLGGVFKRFWMPLLLVAVVALGAYAVVRIRESAVQPPPSAGADANSGITDPFNPPKHITYEVTGTGGSVDVDYLDENGQPPSRRRGGVAVVVHHRDNAAVDVGQHRRPG